MHIRYLKMDGAGNRILVVDERRDNRAPPGADAIRRLGDTATGPGFDQLMWVLPPDSRGMLASYRVFNNDGGEVEQCGNGVRCVARLLAGDDDGPQAFILGSPAGPIEARVGGDGRVSVNMGKPLFEPAAIPFVADHVANFYDLDVNGGQLRIGAVSMGNPHAVLEVDDVASAPVGRLGPIIEHHARFPKQANVGFMNVLAPDCIDLRVHERGVGETLACGTGACAAVAVGRRRGDLGEVVRVRLPGGELVVSCAQPDDSVWLTGDAELISEGTIDL